MLLYFIFDKSLGNPFFMENIFKIKIKKLTTPTLIFPLEGGEDVGRGRGWIPPCRGNDRGEKTGSMNRTTIEKEQWEEREIYIDILLILW